MLSIKNISTSLLVLLLISVTSCYDLEEVNINPNGVDPANAHPNLLMSTVITGVAQTVVNLGYGDIAGVVQHTQKDGWSGSHNSYEWSDQSWNSYYSILRNNDELYNKGVEMGLEFHQGMALVMKSYVFGLITDLWGDAPYSAALQGEAGGAENIKPAFDAQQDIYAGILADLETANTLLSKSQDAYSDINSTQDVLFRGNVRRWQQFANSLALRYYMRLSEKDPGTARAGVEKIAGDPATYPLITNTADDATVDFVGNSDADSWPANTVFDGTGGSNFRRLKMCSTLIETLQRLNDPRLGVWAEKIDIPIVVDDQLESGTDEIIEGIRYVARDIAQQYENSLGFPVDTDPNYVGLPPAWSIVPQAYNLNPNLEQGPQNPHASHLNDRYQNPAGELLKSRLLSAAEVHFILAEAGIKGWSVGASAEEHYYAGVAASLEAWQVSGDFADYVDGSSVAFAGTIEQVLEQKWIASWTAAAEAWFDYRRTGFPALEAGVIVKRPALPLRFYYSLDEIDYNPENAAAAISNLQETSFTAPDGKNSAWSKIWVLQGTGKPY
ncbi:SusD/RagB family nutrient-binding outer membrane lipoprotein [Flavilitoribacter nigricans]|uniref:SusD/RagB family nutrient-binding outer membrane lipoprotein n=1 Tax=Flavilitoribacter nigricans (strain ATCC 23147 / DSM 23189 / NBRC 102662 / NCIMB 1420 / SS-2) TaxID=1122177 RepID=A0A2D0NCY9_FLAN2|nr:SusD/RagB family nutrient-binding outer membrane lipoprotein [Flavilitoribacter nigricans]PHN06268.1 SusD/RagB family nutrient-binding outer membrane lipoprotein [Flavilitoribacter nigricans DSM 23189 = NBRC 102662]